MREYSNQIALPRPERLALAIALCTSLLVTTTLAAPPQTPDDAASQIDKRLLQAMRRDLGFDAKRVALYLQAERSAIARIPEAKRRIGAAYAGSWIEHGKDGGFRLVIATTTRNAAEQVRALGAETQLVPRSLVQLETAKRQLDRLARQRKPNAGIHVWYIDVKTNQIVIEAENKARDAALDFAAISGIDAGAVRFEESRGRPRTIQIVGGERYNIPGGWCSIGFPVLRGDIRGFTTAGHCGAVGTTTTGTNGIVQGRVAGSEFPGVDMAWVQITNPRHWPLRNWVTDHAGGTVPIVGNAEAPVGAAVCRSGGNTGFRCGVITATNVTAHYPQGDVSGLSRSSACAGPGDSGGPFITPDGQAQGMTSGVQIRIGANDNCSENSPITFYQPLQPVLNQYGLTLFTGATPPPPVITQFVCPYYPDSGVNRIACYAIYLADQPATVVWSGGDGGTVYTNAGFSQFITACRDGQRFRVSVTVTNAAGSANAISSLITCNSGPIP